MNLYYQPYEKFIDTSRQPFATFTVRLTDMDYNVINLNNTGNLFIDLSIVLSIWFIKF